MGHNHGSYRVILFCSRDLTGAFANLEPAEVGWDMPSIASA